MDDKIVILEGNGYLAKIQTVPYTREVGRITDPGWVEVLINWLQFYPTINLPSPVVNGDRYHFLLTAEPVTRDQ